MNSLIIKNPRITEKSSLVAGQNAYVFDVATDATKKAVAFAVKDQYKVVPVKVNIVRYPSKRVFTRGKEGSRGGGKKAYVYLKKGDTIQAV
jgi:large subunit ribosomal protein L23